jgi:hypothetical protein
MGLASSVRTPAVAGLKGPHWRISLFPEAGEAGGCLYVERRADSDGGGVWDPVRAEEEAGRRARTKVRRYCAANRLNRLGTLTYAGEGCHDAVQLRGDVARFFRSVRRDLGGDPLAYLWVPELHPGGHGLHVHFAVGRFVRRSLIDAAWGRGFVHIKLLGNLPVGSGTLGEARMAARYVGKYVTKDLGEHRAGGLHRYEVAQRFQPRKVELQGRSVDDVIRQASEVMGRSPEVRWLSEEDGKDGPPRCWVSWAG